MKKLSCHILPSVTFLYLLRVNIVGWNAQHGIHVFNFARKLSQTNSPNLGDRLYRTTNSTMKKKMVEATAVHTAPRAIQNGMEPSILSCGPKPLTATDHGRATAADAAEKSRINVNIICVNVTLQTFWILSRLIRVLAFFFFLPRVTMSLTRMTNLRQR